MLVWLLLACTPDVDVVQRGRRVPARALESTWRLAQQDLEGFVDEAAVPGLAVAVVIDGRTQFATGFGVSGDEPVDAGTLFRWASVSKPVVATAVLQLVDDGLIGLDDPVTDWLPEFTPEGPWSIDEPTVGQLLNHTSAIADRLVWTCDASDEGLQNELNAGFQLPLLAPPGLFYNYSNSGYSALGGILEVALDQPFTELMVDEVFAPMGMRTATYDVDEALAWGGGPGLGGPEGTTVMPLEDWDCAVARPAAWLHGSVYDLARFVEHLDEGPIAPRMTDAIDTHWQGDGESRMGPGLFSVRYRDTVEVWQHEGWVSGFMSAIAWVPSEGLGVVVVANRDKINIAGARNRVLDHFLGFDPESQRHQGQVDAIPNFSLVGRYVQPVYNFAPRWATGVIEIIQFEGSLWLIPADPEIPGTRLYQTDGDTYGFWIADTPQTVRLFEADGAMWMVNRAWVARRD